MSAISLLLESWNLSVIKCQACSAPYPSLRNSCISVQRHSLSCHSKRPSLVYFSLGTSTLQKLSIWPLHFLLRTRGWTRSPQHGSGENLHCFGAPGAVNIWGSFETVAASWLWKTWKRQFMFLFWVGNWSLSPLSLTCINNNHQGQEKHADFKRQQ